MAMERQEPAGTGPDARQSAEPEARRGLLFLMSVNARGRAYGLKVGDVLTRIDGKPFDGRLTSLSARMKGSDAGRVALWFRRDGERRSDRQDWPVIVETAALGQWKSVALPEGETVEAEPTFGLKNWDVFIDKAGRYDAQRSEARLTALLVPIYLVQMRLWGPLALWGALAAVAVPFGWIVGGALHVVIALYFWQAAPALVRMDRMARGFRYWRIIAARNERALHNRVAEMAPQLQFIHARAGVS